jgi:RNA polymerase sigma factor (sigma-70 family)
VFLSPEGYGNKAPVESARPGSERQNPLPGLFRLIVHRFLKCPRPTGILSMMGPEQLGRLIDSHAAALALYARQWCAAPEDVVQEAFLKLAAQPAPPPHAVPWLYAVVRNLALSAARSDRRRRHHEARAAARAPAWFAPPDGGGLDAAAAATALQSLPLEEREVIVAHVWGGLTFEQIGPLIGASAATAYRRYAAGLAALRTKLRVPCPSHPSTPS